jgi:hypothetical protein
VRIGLFIGILAIGIALFLAKKWISDNTLQRLANAFAVVALIAAALVFVVPSATPTEPTPPAAPASNPEATKPTPQPTAIPLTQTAVASATTLLKVQPTTTPAQPTSMQTASQKDSGLATDTPSLPTPTSETVNTPLSINNQTYELDVMANLDWQNSGVEVVSDDEFEISYISQKWTFDINLSPTDALGKPYFTNEEAPVPAANLGSLVAKIDNGTPFYVGNHLTLYADDNGFLYFRINDTWDIGDNDGFIKIEITKKR